MGDVGEIDAAIEAVGSSPQLTILHCVSEYPAPDAHASLLSVPYLRQRYDCGVGYSDHTVGTVACLAACALGAELIEKHFTLDKTLEGSDHILSADPAEMAAITHGCRRIAVMLGSGDKTPNEQEIEARHLMRGLFTEG